MKNPDARTPKSDSLAESLPVTETFGIPPTLFVFAAAILFSTGGLFIKWNTLSAVELSCARSLVAAATVALLTHRAGFRLNPVTATAAILYAVLLLLFVTATKLTTAANAIFLQYTAPIYVLIFEPLFYKEKFKVSDLLTVVGCLAGMSLFFVGELRPQDVSGNIAALVSGLCFAFFTLLLRHPQTRRVNPASSVIYGNLLLAGGTLLALIFVPTLRSNADYFSPHNIAITLYLGIVQIGFAYYLFTLGLARGVRSLDAGIVGYIEPVLNPLWVFLVLRERPSKWALIGGAIIVGAVLVHMKGRVGSKR